MASRGKYLNVLNLSDDANEDEIKKAYKDLALQFHPDKNPDDPNATAKFQELSKAYTHLIKPDLNDEDDFNTDDDYADCDDDDDYFYYPDEEDVILIKLLRFFQFLKTGRHPENRTCKCCGDQLSPYYYDDYCDDDYEESKPQYSARYMQQSSEFTKKSLKDSKTENSSEIEAYEKNKSTRKKNKSSKRGSKSTVSVKPEITQPKKKTKKELLQEQKKREKEMAEIAEKLKENQQHMEEKERKRLEKERQKKEQLHAEPTVLADVNINIGVQKKKEDTVSKSSQNKKKKKRKQRAEANETKSQNTARVHNVTGYTQMKTVQSVKPKVPSVMDWDLQNNYESSAARQPTKVTVKPDGTKLFVKTQTDGWTKNKTYNNKPAKSYTGLSRPVEVQPQDRGYTPTQSWQLPTASAAAPAPRENVWGAPAPRENVWAAPAPQENVWAARQQFVSNVIPKDTAEEEAMLLAALELSKLDHQEQIIRSQIDRGGGSIDDIDICDFTFSDTNNNCSANETFKDMQLNDLCLKESPERSTDMAVGDCDLPNSFDMHVKSHNKVVGDMRPANSMMNNEQSYDSFGMHVKRQNNVGDTRPADSLKTGQSYGSQSQTGIANLSEIYAPPKKFAWPNGIVQNLPTGDMGAEDSDVCSTAGLSHKPLNIETTIPLGVQPQIGDVHSTAIKPVPVPVQTSVAQPPPSSLSQAFSSFPSQRSIGRGRSYIRRADKCPGGMNQPPVQPPPSLHYGRPPGLASFKTGVQKATFEPPPPIPHQNCGGLLDDAWGDDIDDSPLVFTSIKPTQTNQHSLTGASRNVSGLSQVTAFFNNTAPPVVSSSFGSPHA